MRRRGRRPRSNHTEREDDPQFEDLLDVDVASTVGSADLVRSLGLETSSSVYASRRRQ